MELKTCNGQMLWFLFFQCKTCGNVECVEYK